MISLFPSGCFGAERPKPEIPCAETGPRPEDYSSVGRRGTPMEGLKMANCLNVLDGAVNSRRSGV